MAPRPTRSNLKLPDNTIIDSSFLSPQKSVMARRAAELEQNSNGSSSSTPTPDPESSTTARMETAVLKARRKVKEVMEHIDAKEAVDLATYANENVFLFVPNLIGYCRIILAAFSLPLMPYHPKYATILYFLSSIMDVADGKAARALGQTSKFGAVLDMVTDRCTTACLLCFLAIAYQKYALLFQFLITLDFSSHYMHMYSSLATGSTSHKMVTSDVSWILYSYYHNTTTLFIFCFCNETFFVCLYLMKYWTSTIGLSFAPIAYLLEGTVSPEILKVISSFVRQLTWPMLVAGITFPVCFGKQIISGVQFWKASKILVGIDLAERKQAREKAAGIDVKA